MMCDGRQNLVPALHASSGARQLQSEDNKSIEKSSPFSALPGDMLVVRTQNVMQAHPAGNACSKLCTQLLKL